jgi:hypothetical protein
MRREEIGCVGAHWIDLVQYKNHRRAPMKKLMDGHLGLINVG